MTSRISHLLAAVAGALAASGGDTLGPRTCTDVGCSDGLTVTLQSMPTSAYRIEVRPAHVTPRPNGEDCPPRCRQATMLVAIPA